MRYTAQEEYGLRCLLQLARHENKGPMTIEEIAKKEGITPHYVGKLMRILRQGELIMSTRGKKGGYVLARPAVQISVEDALNVLEGRLYSPDNCNKFSGNMSRCVNTTDCSVRALWSILDKTVSNVLSNTMLKDLLSGEKMLHEWHRYGAPASGKKKL